MAFAQFSEGKILGRFGQHTGPYSTLVEARPHRKGVLAFDLLEASREHIQNSAPLLVTQLTAERKLGIENERTEPLALQAFRDGPFDRHLPRISEVIVDNYMDRDPPLMTLDFVDEVLEILINREEYQHLMFQTNLRSVRLRVSLHESRYAGACQDAQKVLSLTNQVETPILFAARFATAGHYQDALDLYRIARRRLEDPEADRRFSIQWYLREIDRLEIAVKEEMEKSDYEVPKSCGFPIGR